MISGRVPVPAQPSGVEPLLRGGVLAGAVIAVAVAPGGQGSVQARESARRCQALGASLAWLQSDPAREAGLKNAIAATLAEHGHIDLLLCDALGAFAGELEAAEDAPGALRASLDGAWNATQAVANAAYIPEDRGGKVVMLAPNSAAGPDPGRQAARAALENMARTLSIEWSRYRIRTTAVLPGGATTPEQVSGLVAFLASKAGDYYSGCSFELTGLG